MKVLKEGQIPKALAWWVGKTATCLRCGCQAELEEGDDLGGALGGGNMPVTENAERHPGGRVWVEASCPTPDCEGVITVSRV